MLSYSVELICERGAYYLQCLHLLDLDTLPRQTGLFVLRSVCTCALVHLIQTAINWGRYPCYSYIAAQRPSDMTFALPALLWSAGLCKDTRVLKINRPRDDVISQLSTPR
ncbi:hypothetical protein J6590_022501 [Homalodisca vitripennis]|nr:hypothetical protein J6590_022501 [Homalodisca vitripennis]